MPVPRVLLVDDHRDILRLLHSTLETLGHEITIVEAPSGEEALLEASQNKVDLLVSDYRLPGMTGVELMHKIRIRYPDVRVILITGISDKKSREEILNAGAAAVFDKPISMTDFLDAVERALGLGRTILPDEDDVDARQHLTLSNLLVNFRQDIGANAVFLLSDRGRVLARAGDLKDSSMEASLLSALMAIYSAGIKVSRYIHQEELEHFHVFAGGDHDLLLIPINPAYALLVAGIELATSDSILDTVSAMQAVRKEIRKSLKSIGVAPVITDVDEPKVMEDDSFSQEEGMPAELEAILKSKKKLTTDELEAFWNQAAEQQENVSTSPGVISYEQARQLGLAPGEEAS